MLQPRPGMHRRRQRRQTYRPSARCRTQGVVNATHQHCADTEVQPRSSPSQCALERTHPPANWWCVRQECALDAEFDRLSSRTKSGRLKKVALSALKCRQRWLETPCVRRWPRVWFVQGGAVSKCVCAVCPSLACATKRNGTARCPPEARACTLCGAVTLSSCHDGSDILDENAGAPSRHGSAAPHREFSLRMATDRKRAGDHHLLYCSLD